MPGKTGSDGVNHAFHVDVQNLLGGGSAEVSTTPSIADARVGEHQVARTQARLDARHCSIEGRLIAHVRCRKSHTFSTDLFSDRLEPLGSTGDEPDGPAALVQLDSDALANSGRGAGDDRYLHESLLGFTIRLLSPKPSLTT